MFGSKQRFWIWEKDPYEASVKKVATLCQKLSIIFEYRIEYRIIFYYILYSKVLCWDENIKI